MRLTVNCLTQYILWQFFEYQIQEILLKIIIYVVNLLKKQACYQILQF